MDRRVAAPGKHLFAVLACVILLVAGPAVAGEHDLLVITVADLEPALAAWRLHREKQGLKITVERCNSGADEESRAAERARLVERIRALAPAYVMIAGGVGHVPVFSVTEKKLGRTCESDQPYGLPDSKTGLPAISVGRIPAADADQLRAALAKVIRHETEFHPGEQRNTIQFLAGTGGYGKMVDTMIESVATGLLSKQLAQHYRLGVIYLSPASPYFVPPGELLKRTRATFEASPLLVVYAGHGNNRSFAPLWYRGINPYLSVASAKGMKCGAGYPFFFSITCRTGDFENAEKPGLCASLMLEPEGPVCAFGSSENSQPLPNLLIQQGLLAHLANGDAATVGKAVARMRADFRDRENRVGRFLDRMVQGEVDQAARKRHHQYLYNLFGDPATRLRFPARDLALTLASEEGGRVVLTGKSPTVTEGTALVRLDVSRRKLLGRVEPHAKYKKPEEADAVIRRNHEMAANKTIWKVEAPVRGGVFRAEVDVKPLVPARLLRRGPVALFFRVYAWNDGADAVGASRFEFAPPAPPKKPAGNEKARKPR